MKNFPTYVLRLSTVALAAAACSYVVGLSGVNPAHAITDSRCTDGAFISHAPVPANLTADNPTSNVSDPVSLSVAGATNAPPVSLPAIGSNLLPNPSLENRSGESPVGWDGSQTGPNNAAFSTVIGHNSGHAARIDITTYRGGTSAWLPAYAPVTGGSYYEFSDYYRSNVETYVQVTLKNATGPTQTIYLGAAAPSMTWAPYQAGFFVPFGMTLAQVSHNLAAIGALETDDYSLVAIHSQGYVSPVISLALLGGSESDLTQALPSLTHYGFSATLYVDTGFLGQSGYLTPGSLYGFTSAGDEVASSGIDQSNLTTIASKKLSDQLSVSKSGLESCYGQVTDFATPFGAFNASTTTAVSQYYDTNLSRNAGFNSPSELNPYALKVETVQTDTTSAQLEDWIDTAKADRLWLILLYHAIDNQPDGLSRPPALFESDLQQIYASGVAVKTVRGAYTLVRNQ